MAYGQNIDWDFGEAYISGVKLKQIKEDHEFSKLQQAEWQASAAHREQMRALELELGTLGKTREQTANDLDQLQMMRIKALMPEEVANAQANRKLTKAQTRGARADADVAEATKSDRIGQSKSQASTSQSVALGAQISNIQAIGQTLKDGLNEFTSQDLLNIVKLNGTPDGASTDVMVKMLRDEIGGMRKETARNRAQLDDARTQEGYLRMGQTIDLLQRLGPEGAQALKGQGLFPDAMLDAIVGSEQSLTPDQKSALGGIDKALASTFDELGTIEGQIAPYRAREAKGETIQNAWGPSNEAADYEGLKKTLTEIQGKREFLEGERGRVTGKGGKKAEAPRLKSEGTSISAVLDKMDIDTKVVKPEDIVDYLAGQGVKATLAEVKAYLKTR